jgi:folate-binding protein YgfZ
MKTALLSDRGVIKVTGEGAQAFLEGLLTAAVDTMAQGDARFSALLTPQGKIIADFIIVRTADGGDGFYLDCARALVATLVERLNFYKLRAKVSVEDCSDTLAVIAAWGGGAEAISLEQGISYPDPRLAELGTRCILPHGAVAETIAKLGAERADETQYDAHRLALGVPRGGVDFVYGDAFPHETNMDQLHGVDFHKGCFVGQEVVSRMEHRGTARARIVPVAYDEFAPEGGAPVLAGEKRVGTMGSAAEGHGLALLRLDRVQDALDEGTALIAGGIALRPVRPDWAQFTFPGEGKPQ